jgi:hypothetical protein
MPLIKSANLYLFIRGRERRGRREEGKGREMFFDILYISSN